MWRIFIGVRIEVILFIEYCAATSQSVIVLISYCLLAQHWLSLSLSLSLSDGTDRTQPGRAYQVHWDKYAGNSTGINYFILGDFFFSKYEILV